MTLNIVDKIVQFRLFIAGMEIDPKDVDIDSISIKNNAFGEPGSLSFTLNDVNYKYSINEQDLIDIANSQSGSVNITTPIVGKNRVLVKKVTAQKIELSDHYVTLLSQYNSNVPKYIPSFEFVFKGSIFHYRDVVRLWYFDDFDMNWHWGFTGFLTGKTPTYGSDGTMSWEITCLDVKWLLQLAEVSTSLAVFVPQEIRNLLQNINTLGSSFDFDPVQNNLSNMDLEKVFTYAIYGTIGIEGVDGVRAASGQVSGLSYKSQNKTFQFVIENSALPNGSVTMEIDTKAAGFFNSSTPVKKIYGQDGINVASWEKMLDTTVKPSDLINRALQVISTSTDNMNSVLKLANATVDNVDSVPIDTVIKIIGENPDLYPADSGTFYMLLPYAINSALLRDMVQKDFNSTDQTVYNFNSKLAILNGIIKPLMFYFWSAPNGDLVLEFSFMNYSNTDFNEYADVYKVGKEGFVGNVVEPISSTNISTLFVGTPNYVQSDLTSVANALNPVGTRYFILEPMLKYLGIQTESVSNLHNLITSPKEMDYNLVLMATKSLGNSVGFEVTVMNKANIKPNRPFYIPDLQKVGWINNYSTGLKTTRLSLNYIRSWGGRRDSNGNPVFDIVGEVIRADCLPVDYKRLMEG